MHNAGLYTIRNIYIYIAHVMYAKRSCQARMLFSKVTPSPRNRTRARAVAMTTRSRAARLLYISIIPRCSPMSRRSSIQTLFVDCRGILLFSPPLLCTLCRGVHRAELFLSGKCGLLEARALARTFGLLQGKFKFPRMYS